MADTNRRRQVAVIVAGNDGIFADDQEADLTVRYAEFANGIEDATFSVIPKHAGDGNYIEVWASPS